MLNGVGGRTIAEAKQRLTYGEVRAWAAYRHKHGSLNQGQRLEYHTAVIATLIAKAMGWQKQLTDFMPHYNEDDHEIDLETAMERWS